MVLKVKVARGEDEGLVGYAYLVRGAVSLGDAGNPTDPYYRILASPMADNELAEDWDSAPICVQADLELEDNNGGSQG